MGLGFGDKGLEMALNPKPYLALGSAAFCDTHGTTMLRPLTSPRKKWGSRPKIRGTLLEVPIVRTIVFWGLYWGPLIFGNYQMKSVGSEQFISLTADQGFGVDYIQVFL